MSVFISTYRQSDEQIQNLLTDWNGNTWEYGYTYLLGSYDSTPTPVPTKPQVLYIPDPGADPNGANYLNYGNCLYVIMGVVKRGRVYGDGPTNSVVKTGTAFYHPCASTGIGASGQPGTGPWPPFETVSAGSDTITLVDPGDASMLAERRWIMLEGIDLQGFGYPSNPQFSELKFITKIDAGTGVVTFSEPLVHSYKSTWPFWDHGDGSHADLGGPGTIVMLGINHGCAYDVRDLGFANTTAQSTFGTANFDRYVNCHWLSGGSGWSPVPSVQHHSYFKDCEMLGDKIEVDKMIDYLEYDNCQISRLQMQSPCNYHLIKNCTIEQIDGAGLDVVVENCTINKWFGAGMTQSYGYSNSLTLRDSTIGATDFSWGSRNVTLGDAIIETIASGGGELTIPKATFTGTDARGNLAPGGCYGITGSSGTIGPFFKITDIRRSNPADYESDIILTTTLTGTEPQIVDALGYGGGIVLHPGPRVSVENCTGCHEIEMEALFPGPHPVMQYCRYEDVSVSGTDGPSTTCTGVLVSITINVTRVYSGAVYPAISMRLATFGVNLWPDWLDGVTSRYGVLIDLMQTGTRTITPTTATGAVGADSFAAFGADQWWASAGPVQFTFHTNYSTNPMDISADDPSLWPIVDMEFVFDQQFDPDA